LQKANINYTTTIFRARCVSSVVQENNIKDFNVVNEPILGYKQGSKERKELVEALENAKSQVVDIPIMINGEKITTKDVRYQTMPHDHQKKIAKFYYADTKLIERAIGKCVETQQKWDKVPLKERVAIYEKAADLMAGKYRQKLNAATMLGQSKTVIQAEIDAAAELIDFVRFNLYFLKENAKYQPISENPKVTKNSVRFRGIDGFIAAVSPFNFTAIGGNLSYTPALMGNSVLWKPSDTAMLSNWTIYEIMREAGVPEGVVVSTREIRDTGKKQTFLSNIKLN
jgi:1-pyrroline-5-carboxylate dehydrogenase